MRSYYEKIDNNDILLEKANEFAKMALINFYEKMGLNFKLCMEVNNIDPLIDETFSVGGVKGDGHYEATEDIIVIDCDYLTKMSKKIIDAADALKEKLEKNIIINVAETIVHERIHALRRIRTPKNIIPIDDYNSMLRNSHVREFGESFDYVIPCDVVLENHNFITNKKDLLEILSQQEALEDAVTEALAQIIIYNAIPKFSNYSIKQLALKVMNDDNDCVVAGAKIIDVMDDDMIKWFITTRFVENQYKDLFYEMFGENYYILLSDIGEIDKAVLSGDFPPKGILEEFDEILLKHKSRSNKNTR